LNIDDTFLDPLATIVRVSSSTTSSDIHVRTKSSFEVLVRYIFEGKSNCPLTIISTLVLSVTKNEYVELVATVTINTAGAFILGGKVSVENDISDYATVAT